MNKRYILKKNYDIEKLINKRVSVGDQYYAIYYNEIQNDTPKIAISISKHLGNAVLRNHEKRVHREILRTVISEMNNLELLLIIKRKSLLLNYDDKVKDVKRLIGIINKKRRKR